ncbi:MAG TPA: hypothetical protein PKD85_11380 [Saprospiraceae bacterium]|nr:hypothetical protein [Saprospiraceae bacterium]
MKALFPISKYKTKVMCAYYKISDGYKTLNITGFVQIFERVKEFKDAKELSLEMAIFWHGFFKECSEKNTKLLSSTFKKITVTTISIEEEWIKELLETESDYKLKTLDFRAHVSLNTYGLLLTYISQHINLNYMITDIQIYKGEKNILAGEQTLEILKINNIIVRNKKCIENCQKTCLNLIANRKYRKTSLSCLPKDIVNIIVRNLWEDRFDRIWYLKKLKDDVITHFLRYSWPFTHKEYDYRIVDDMELFAKDKYEFTVLNNLMTLGKNEKY